MGKMFFNILATFAEFEADLIRMRTREGMAIARAKGELRGKQPKLSDRQQRELCRMHAKGEYSISDLAEFLLRLKTNRLSYTQPAPFPLAYDPAPYRNRPASDLTFRSGPDGSHNSATRAHAVELLMGRLRVVDTGATATPSFRPERVKVK